MRWAVSRLPRARSRAAHRQCPHKAALSRTARLGIALDVVGFGDENAELTASCFSKMIEDHP